MTSIYAAASHTMRRFVCTPNTFFMQTQRGITISSTPHVKAFSSKAMLSLTMHVTIHIITVLLALLTSTASAAPFLLSYDLSPSPLRIAGVSELSAGRSIPSPLIIAIRCSKAVSTDGYEEVPVANAAYGQVVKNQ